MLNRCREARATYAPKLGSQLKGNYIPSPQKKKRNRKVGEVQSVEKFNQQSDKGSTSNRQTNITLECV